MLLRTPVYTDSSLYFEKGGSLERQISP